jgi:integrase
MIKRQWSKRKKKFIHLLDVRLESGERIRRSFETKSEAEAVESLYKRNKVIERYALPVALDSPLLSDLIAKRNATLEQNGICRKEKNRTKKVFADFVSLLPKNICVDQVTRQLIELYVKKRFDDKISPQSINRELNCIAALLNNADHYYAALESWRPPKMPRPRVFTGRRERVWNDAEIAGVLAQLEAPRKPDEDLRAVTARHRVAHVTRFCLLTGLRPGEVVKIRGCDIDWQTCKIRVAQGKTGGSVKIIGPLFGASMEILKSYAETRVSAEDFIFFRGTNLPWKFYRILREACERAGVRYGKNTPGGLVLYDARHTVTTHLLENGVSPATVKEWMGWADSSFVLYYSHATDKSREKAGRTLERLAGRKLKAVA